MNGVDRADHIRSYYRTNRRNYRTWKPLWDCLFHMTICNSATIWANKGFSKKKEGQLDFRVRLSSQLMSHSSAYNYTTPIDGFGVQTNLKNHVIASPDTCGGIHEVLSKVAKECKACMSQGRTAQGAWKRKELPRAFSQLHPDRRGWREDEEITVASNEIWLFGLPNTSMSARPLLGRACPTIKA
jgi:hypothetical protein